MSISILQEPLIMKSETNPRVLKQCNSNLVRSSKSFGFIFGFVLGVITQLALMSVDLYFIRIYGSCFMKNHKVFIISGIVSPLCVAVMTMAIVVAVENFFHEKYLILQPRNSATWNRIRVNFGFHAGAGMVIGHSLTWCVWDIFFLDYFGGAMLVHSSLMLLNLSALFIAKQLFFKNLPKDDENDPDNKNTNTSLPVYQA